MPQDNLILPLLESNECFPYQPKAALIVFENQGQAPDYLELREIRKDGSMAAAKPVSKKFIQNVLSSFSKEYRSVPHGQIPPNMLYCDTRQGHEAYIWYNAPGKRHRFFSPSLGLEDGVYFVPGTLYVVQNEELSVFCFQGKKPALDKTLLGVPYFNVYGSGKVCMGNARPRIPEKDQLCFEDVLYAWEYAFWNSIDVHTNGSPSTKGNLIETIKEYKDKPFDTQELNQRSDHLTINEIIRKLK